MPDVFLSYNHADRSVAATFAEAFTGEGWDVWWDQEIGSGETYDEVTEQALRAAGAVVVLWSPRSVASRWVRAEATLADRHNKLAPVMVERCERPIMFELTQTADLTGWGGDRSDPAWRRLVGEVRQAIARTAAATPVADSPAPAARPKPVRGRRGGVPALAVLPFANRSGVAEDEVFAFGMVEDIIDAMSQGVDLRVISSSAVARFRTGGAPDLAGLARELGVRYVLEGNVRRVGEDLRVTTQLVDAKSGNILWTQKFDRPLAQLAQLQADLVLEVAARLRTQSHRAEIERALRKPDDLTAWEAVMRAMAAYRKVTGPALMLGLREAQKAVEIAPDYGLAVALVAQAQSLIYNQLMPDDPAEVARIAAQAEKAIALEPDNPVVLSTAATAFYHLGCAEAALAAAERAVQLNPNNEFAHFAYAVAATLLDRCEEAIAHFDREQELAPDHPVTWASLLWRACAEVKAGRWPAALDAYEHSLRLTPDNAWPNLGKAICCRELGRHEEAQRFFARFRQAEPETPLALWELRDSRAGVNNDHRRRYRDHLRALWAESEGADRGPAGAGAPSATPAAPASEAQTART